jgi:ATP/ADP translocase
MHAFAVASAASRLLVLLHVLATAASASTHHHGHHHLQSKNSHVNGKIWNRGRLLLVPIVANGVARHDNNYRGVATVTVSSSSAGSTVAASPDYEDDETKQRPILHHHNNHPHHPKNSRGTSRRRRQDVVVVVGDFRIRRIMMMARGGGDGEIISCDEEIDDDFNTNNNAQRSWIEEVVDGESRGGEARVIANNGAASVLVRGGGGGSGGNGDNHTNKTSNKAKTSSIVSSSSSVLPTSSSLVSVLSSSPRTLAALSMATCMSLHYLAYSLARPATMTLFTSSRLGFGGEGGGSVSSAYPLAMTLIGPASFGLLLLYGFALDARGPYGALQFTTLGCASLLGLSSLVIDRIDAMIPTITTSNGGTGTGTGTATTMTKYIVGALFVFRESYVQLLTSQHWSFISSILTPSESSRWFAPISGLTSITSALAAAGVGKLSAVLGLQGVLLVAAVVLGGSVGFGRMAYSIAEKNGFNPAEEHERKKKQKQQLQQLSASSSSSSATRRNVLKSSSPSGHQSNNHRVKDSLFAKAGDVFKREPTLWALFCEILACQGLSTLLNVCCITRVSEAMPDDAERAGWMGKFFASINVLSCILQFGVLPVTSSYFEPGTLWRGMPLLMLAMTLPLAFPKLGLGIFGVGGSSADPSLAMVASAFLVMKTLEFSVRRMLDEMVYVPLDYESRFLGKEVIGVLGYRFGKSAASLALSGLTSFFGAVGLRELSYLTTGAAGVWLGAAWRLSNLVPTREQAEEAYKQMKKKDE